MYSSTWDRAIEIEVGAEFVTIRDGNGKTKTARILEQTTDGRILCDRVIHAEHSHYRGYKAQGCFVTEFVPSDTGE